jgi:hypothetical protein
MAEPAFEGPGKGADVGIAEQESDLRDVVVGMFGVRVKTWLEISR